MSQNIRQVDMPEAGEGVFLLFRNRDLLTLQNKFGKEWFATAAQRLGDFDIQFTEECLKVGGQVKDARQEIKLDDLERITMGEICMRVLDALYLANFGRKFEAHLRWIEEETKKASAAGGEDKQSPPSGSPVVL